jgi:DNA-binding NtrC family response regulator
VERVLNDELIKVLCSRSWPGNVRELRNVVERATIMVDGSMQGEALFTSASPASPEPPPPPLPDSNSPGPDGAPALQLPRAYLEMDYKAAKERLLEQFELQYLERLMKRHGTNISGIAREAGVDRHLVRNLLRKHKLV